MDEEMSTVHFGLWGTGVSKVIIWEESEMFSRLIGFASGSGLAVEAEFGIPSSLGDREGKERTNRLSD